ncbi:MAG: FAD-dependent oxidoreductase [Planctomycetota bacterium]|jgi:hypothetical protein
MFTASRKEIRTLIDRFHYPKKGPGMLWEAVKAAVERNGGEVLLHQKARRIFREGRRITGVVADGEAGVNLYPVSQLISSMPITDFVLRLEPRPPLQILDAARKLKYRAFLTVCLIIDQPDLFPDQWVYVHDPNVKMGRIQNYKNWSPYMVPDPTKTGLGLEYFCNKGDEIWNMPDEELIELGKEELSRMGLVDREAVEDGTVFRVPKAYPVYCDGYDDHLRSLRGFLEGLENFQSVGRNGLFRYNNMDHSMLTAFIAADHVCGKKEQDVWSVNEEQQYLEEAKKEEEGAEPDEAGLWAELEVAFRKIDKTALGVAFGAVCGLGLLLMTWVLVLKGGEVVGPTLGLLRQYFPGYSVTWPGGLVGFLYAFAVGFLTGWFGAAIRNLIVVLLLILARWKVRKAHLNRLLDYI